MTLYFQMFNMVFDKTLTVGKLKKKITSIAQARNIALGNYGI